MNQLCCLVNTAIFCKGCTRKYCYSCYSGTKWSDLIIENGSKEIVPLLKCNNECFHPESECAKAGHDWEEYVSIFLSRHRQCLRRCGITIQVYFERTKSWEFV